MPIVPWIGARLRYLARLLYRLAELCFSFCWAHQAWLKKFVGVPAFYFSIAAAIRYFVFHYLDTYIPFCDPWRDISTPIIGGPVTPPLPFAGLLSSSILWMCPRPGYARSTTIQNFDTFATLSNITDQLSDSLVDYHDLHSLCEEARFGATWLGKELETLRKPPKGNNPPKPLPESLVNFKNLLADVGAFEEGFLENRSTAIREMRGDLSEFEQIIETRSASYDVKSYIYNPFVAKNQEDVIEFNEWTTKKYNHTLSSKIKQSAVLLERVKEMKQKIELIGDNIIYVRMLAHSARPKGAFRSERHRRYFGRVTGVDEVCDKEMEVFERVMSKLVGGERVGGKTLPALELAVFEMLPQIREARRVLKNVVDVTGLRREQEVKWTDVSQGYEMARRKSNGTQVVWEWSPELVQIEEARIAVRIVELKEGLTRQLDELAKAKDRLEKRGPPRR